MNEPTEVAVTVFTDGRKPPACHCFSSECTKGRIIPYLLELLLVKIAHGQSAAMAGQDIPIHPDTGMKPCDIAGYFLPYGIADLIT